MLVVHGTWANGTPLVWAEDSGLPPQAPPRRGRPSRADLVITTYQTAVCDL